MSLRNTNNLRFLLHVWVQRRAAAVVVLVSAAVVVLVSAGKSSRLRSASSLGGFSAEASAAGFEKLPLACVNTSIGSLN